MTYEIKDRHDAQLYISSTDLLEEAGAALDRCEDVTLVVERHPASGVQVETLIIHAQGGASGDAGRAGQTVGGDAAWGDYIDDGYGGYMVHDESGEIYRLNGTMSEEV
jgi:hypothetical protein